MLESKEGGTMGVVQEQKGKSRLQEQKIRKDSDEVSI